MNCAVIFGGSGFIGTFFAKHLIEEHNFSKVYLYDNESIKNKNSDYRRKIINLHQEIIIIEGDVKKSIEWIPEETINLVANFAAVHREPGHQPYEYYECNILGAEIYVIGLNALIAKKLYLQALSHLMVQAKKSEMSYQSSSCYTLWMLKIGGGKNSSSMAIKEKDRQLVIVRPGVVFGPSEGGNVTRLINAVHKRYFFYMGNRQTRKAGIYVKELCRAMMWVLNSDKAIAQGFSLFNMSMNPGPSIEEYVDSIARTGNIKFGFPPCPVHFYLLLPI